MQVNGGGGVLFNDAPTLRAIRTIGAAHRRFGTTGFLPTLISADLEVVARAIAAARGAIEAGVPGVLGLHIEGPFLNVARKGVHDAAKLRELDASAIGLLTSLGGGRTVLTLAPEMTTPRLIRELVGCRRPRVARATPTPPTRRSARPAPRPARLYASVQCHVAADQPRARSGRRSA